MTSTATWISSPAGDSLYELKTRYDAMMALYGVTRTTFMACLAFLGDRFDVKSEYVAGTGRADIWVRRLYGPGCNMVLEIKRVEEGQDPEILSGRALEQILNHRYTAGLKGRTPVFGIALGGGKPSVIRKELFI